MHEKIKRVQAAIDTIFFNPDKYNNPEKLIKHLEYKLERIQRIQKTQKKVRKFNEKLLVNFPIYKS